MAFDSKGLDDYIDVARRIAEFRAKHPEGSLQPVNPQQPFEIREVVGTDKSGKEQRGTFIIYTAAAYRTPDDTRPGIGCAYEVFPGRTPYTAGSELQNAETAAWGRAIVAALAADTRGGVASQQEVRNRQAERDQSAPAQSRQNGGNGNSARPSNQGPHGNGEQAVDHDAQKFADEAHEITTPRGMEDVHRRAREAGKVGGYVRNPSSGGLGKLAVYLDWRSKQVRAAVQLSPDDPWAPKVEELDSTASADSALDEVARMLDAGAIDAERAGRIENAVIARFPDAGRDELAAAS